MNVLDKLHMKEPTYGARRFKTVLNRDHDFTVGRGRLRRLMQLANIRPCYPKPNTSKRGKGAKIYPYLLREMEIVEPNQVWCTDITYIPMATGFCYLAAVLGWAVSTTIDTNLCLEAWKVAVMKNTGQLPGIMNTDQGSQYTSEEWTQTMEESGVKISMDGKGRWVDNVFIERLWRSVKYEDIYLKSYETPRELERGLAKWFDRYNHYRPHSHHDGLTPWVVYSTLEKTGDRNVA